MKTPRIVGQTKISIYVCICGRKVPRIQNKCAHVLPTFPYCMWGGGGGGGGGGAL